jgi:hypothetical protein
MRRGLFFLGLVAMVAVLAVPGRVGDRAPRRRAPRRQGVDGQTGGIIDSIGPHPLRELMDGSFNTALALPGFCDILRP